MNEYEMTDEKWLTTINPVVVWFDHNTAPFQTIVEALIELGNNDPDNRKKHWESIRALFATVDNSPIKRGRRTTIDDEVMGIIESFEEPFMEVCQTAFTDALFGSLTLPRGRYALYSDSAEYAADEWDSARSLLMGAYKNHVNTEGIDLTKPQWNGKVNKNELPVIVAGVKAESEDSEDN